MVTTSEGCAYNFSSFHNIMFKCVRYFIEILMCMDYIDTLKNVKDPHVLLTYIVFSNLPPQIVF